MTDRDARTNVAATGTFRLGGDLLVNRLGFGAMRLTGRGILGEPDDPEEARRVLRRAAELGVNLIDTADSYGPEVSERLIAEALRPYPDNLVVATKGGLTRPGGRWVPDGRPEHLREACEGSLRRLKVECIDLYQLHRLDPKIARQCQDQGRLRLCDRGRQTQSTPHRCWWTLLHITAPWTDPYPASSEAPSSIRSLDLGEGLAGGVVAVATAVEQLARPRHILGLRRLTDALAAANRPDPPRLAGLCAAEAGIVAALLRAGRALGDAAIVAVALERAP